MRRDPIVRIFRVCLGAGIFVTIGFLLLLGNEVLRDDQRPRVKHEWELAGDATSLVSSSEEAQVSDTQSTRGNVEPAQPPVVDAVPAAPARAGNLVVPHATDLVGNERQPAGQMADRAGSFEDALPMPPPRPAQGNAKPEPKPASLQPLER